MPTAHRRSVNLWSLLLMASAIDVVDLGGGRFPIVLTPFLALGAIVGLVALLRMPLWPRAGCGEALSLSAFVADQGFLISFLVLATFSAVFTARDSLEAGVPRLFYLYLIAGFAIVFAVCTRDRIDRIVLRGTAWYIALDAIYVVVQYASIYFDIPALSQLTITSVGELLRPGGLTGDPNRAAVNLLLMVGMRYVAMRHRRLAGIGGWPSGLAIVLSLATLSRSGLLALAALLVTIAVLSDAPFVRKAQWMAATAGITCALSAAASVFLSGSAIAVTATEAMVSDPHRQTSTSAHFGLIRRGIDLTTEEPKAFFIGKGWGTEYEYTKEFFQTTKVGNFHSMYSSMLVQCGLLGFLPFILLLIRPVWIRSTWVALTPVLLLGGAFYQFHGEPFWWIAVSLANIPGCGSSCGGPIGLQTAQG